MAFDYTKAEGMGTDTIDRGVLGRPFINIIQKGSPEFDETHFKYGEKRIDGCRPGQLLLESEHVVLTQPITVIPLAQLPHYTEWKANKGGFAANRNIDVINHPDYRKEAPGSPNQYKEYLGQNELQYTILFIVLFLHDGVWKKGMIAFTNKQLKKARIWSKMLLGLKFPDNPSLVPPIFAAKYQIKTVTESNDKGGWFGYEIGPAVVLNPETEQDLLEQAYEASKVAQMELPRATQQAALAAPVAVNEDEAPY